MAVPALAITSYELPRAAHVELVVYAQVTHKHLQPIGLGVGVILEEVEPIVLRNVVFHEIPHSLKHAWHRTLVTVGDHKHSVRDLAVARASEEDEASVQVVVQGTVCGNCECVHAVFGGQNCYKETFTDSQLRAGVLGPEGAKRKATVIQGGFWHNPSL